MWRRSKASTPPRAFGSTPWPAGAGRPTGGFASSPRRAATGTGIWRPPASAPETSSAGRSGFPLPGGPRGLPEAPGRRDSGKRSGKAASRRPAGLSRPTNSTSELLQVVGTGHIVQAGGPWGLGRGGFDDVIQRTAAVRDRHRQSHRENNRGSDPERHDQSSRPSGPEGLPA